MPDNLRPHEAKQKTADSRTGKRVASADDHGDDGKQHRMEAGVGIEADVVGGKQRTGRGEDSSECKGDQPMCVHIVAEKCELSRVISESAEAQTDVRRAKHHPNTEQKCGGDTDHDELRLGEDRVAEMHRGVKTGAESFGVVAPQDRDDLNEHDVDAERGDQMGTIRGTFTHESCVIQPLADHRQSNDNRDGDPDSENRRPTGFFSRKNEIRCQRVKPGKPNEEHARRQIDHLERHREESDGGAGNEAVEDNLHGER